MTVSTGERVGGGVLRVPGAVVGTLQRSMSDPRVMGLLRAGPRVGEFLVRGQRRSAAAATDDTIVPMRLSPMLAAQAFVDELLIAALRHPDLLPKDEEFAPAAADVRDARDYFAEHGWLEDPAAYHREPPPPAEGRAEQGWSLGFSFEHVAYPSEWAPHPGEPGGRRWLGHEPNRTAHTWVSRAPGAERGTWLVCVHGFGMGQHAGLDLRAFRTQQLHRAGVHVAVPVLPFHGPRASGRIRGEDFMTIDMVDSLHGVAQAVWDVRRLVRWLREEHDAQTVGLLGLSLGGLVASLVASLEPDLACAIVGIPVVDLPDLFRRHSPPEITRKANDLGVLGDDVDAIFAVASPVALSCALPVERRYLFAGLGDRMSTFGQARRLWLHWDRPRMLSYQGGHVGFYWSQACREFVDDAVAESLGSGLRAPAER